jgi:DNA replication licensing factor MCM2
VPHFYAAGKNRDYAPNELLDRYSDRDIDDEGDFDEMSAAARRAAEARMNRRDRLERAGKQGTRAANRGRAPQFLEDDDMDDEDALGDDLGVARMKRRTRRQYDERRDVDDVDSADDVGENPSGQLDVYSSVFHYRKYPSNN